MINLNVVDETKHSHLSLLTLTRMLLFLLIHNRYLPVLISLSHLISEQLQLLFKNRS